MGGISNVVKAGMPRSFKPKDMLKFGTPKSDIARQKNIWKATWKPQPAEGSATTRPGPLVSQMSPEELEELRRRRGMQSRRPSSTVLSSGSEDEALGG